MCSKNQEKAAKEGVRQCDKRKTHLPVAGSAADAERGHKPKERAGGLERLERQERTPHRSYGHERSH